MQLEDKLLPVLVRTHDSPLRTETPPSPSPRRMVELLQVVLRLVLQEELVLLLRPAPLGQRNSCCR